VKEAEPLILTKIGDGSETRVEIAKDKQYYDEIAERSLGTRKEFRIAGPKENCSWKGQKTSLDVRYYEGDGHNMNDQYNRKTRIQTISGLKRRT
jgi:hypothetical protein